MLEKIDPYPSVYLSINHLMRGALSDKVGTKPMRDIQNVVVNGVRNGMVEVRVFDQAVFRGMHQCPKLSFDISQRVRSDVFYAIADNIHRNSISMGWTPMFMMMDIPIKINDALGVEAPW